jgi:two-component system CheB/CheR fusion protein
LSDIVGQLKYSTRREDVQTVLSSLQPLEKRVEREDGSAHYLMRVLPYRTPDSLVGGSLIPFVDVTSIVRAEQRQRLLVDELNHRVKNMLTVVISVATNSLRRADSCADGGVCAAQPRGVVADSVAGHSAGGVAAVHF